MNEIMGKYIAENSTESMKELLYELFQDFLHANNASIENNTDKIQKKFLKDFLKESLEDFKNETLEGFLNELLEKFLKKLIEDFLDEFLETSKNTESSKILKQILEKYLKKNLKEFKKRNHSKKLKDNPWRKFLRNP